MYVVFRFYISLMIFISDQCINIDRVIMLYVNLRKLFLCIRIGHYGAIQMLYYYYIIVIFFLFLC